MTVDDEYDWLLSPVLVSEIDSLVDPGFGQSVPGTRLWNSRWLVRASRMSNQVARRSNQMATDQRSNENDMPVKLMMLHHLNLLLKLSFLVFFDVRVPWYSSKSVIILIFCLNSNNIDLEAKIVGLKTQKGTKISQTKINSLCNFPGHAAPTTSVLARRWQTTEASTSATSKRTFSKYYINRTDKMPLCSHR